MAAGPTDAVRVESVSNPRLKALAVVGLVGVGLGLLVFGAAIWLSDDKPGPEVVTKQSTTQVTKPADEATKGGTTTTEVSSEDTTSEGNPTLRSASVAVALFGIGALLFLTGVFFGRIQEVTLPGGGGLKLSPESQAALVEKATKQVKENPDLDDTPETVRKLYEAALLRLVLALPAVESTGGPAPYPPPQHGVALGDDVLDVAVEAASEQIASSDGA